MQGSLGMDASVEVMQRVLGGKKHRTQLGALGLVLVHEVGHGLGHGFFMGRPG